MRSSALAVVLVALAGCAQPTHIVLEPKQPSIRSKTESIHMIAHVMTSHMEDAEAHVSWSIEDPKVATVDATGEVRGLGSGRTKVIATYKNLVASIPVDVLFVEKITSAMDKVELSKEKGDPVSPGITVASYDGLPLKDRVNLVDYKVKDDKICRVDKSGQFWPIEEGETVVTATLDGKSIDITCSVAKN